MVYHLRKLMYGNITYINVWDIVLFPRVSYGNYKKLAANWGRLLKRSNAPNYLTSRTRLYQLVTFKIFVLDYILLVEIGSFAPARLRIMSRSNIKLRIMGNPGS